MSIQTVTTSSASLSLSRIAGSIRGISKRRARRLAMSELLTIAPNRLDDLGIDLGDVAEALRCLPSAGRILEARRAVRAGARPRS
jgi:hypothetical protein